MSSRTLSPRRRSLLAAMGIDVWVRRGAARVPPSTEPEAFADVPAPANDDQVRAIASVAAPQLAPAVTPPGPDTAGASSVDAAAVQIDVLALAGSGAVVVGRFDTPAQRRIGQGIFRALAGPGAEPTTARFIWPPPASSIGGSASAAASAYRAFLTGQLGRADGRCLVLLGDAATAALGDDESKPLPVPVIRGPTALALTQHPEAKKALWLSIAAVKQR